MVAKVSTNSAPVTVTPTVTDNEGAQGTASVVIDVDDPPNEAPERGGGGHDAEIGQGAADGLVLLVGTGDPTGRSLYPLGLR